jgi:hypothetical protein
MQGPKLANKLFVKSVKNDEGGFLDASSDIRNLSEKDETIEVGEYHLVRKIHVINRTAIFEGK